MKQFTLITSALVLTASSVFAQSGGVYSPPWMQSTEGALYGYYFGRYPDSRYHMADGHNQQTSVLKDLRLRLDSRSYYSYNGGGRTWSNVSLRMSKTDMTKFSKTFSSNIVGSQTLVFSGSVTWPTLSGTPIATVWGGPQGEYRFPFGATGTSQYVHLGGDMLCDFEFTGGSLENNVTWSSSSSRYYYFDGYGLPTSAASGLGRYVPATRLNNTSSGVTTRCNDSAMTTSTGSYLYLNATVYGSRYTIHNYRNRVYFYSYSYYTAYDAPVIHAYGFTTNDTGIDVGTGCNKLHMTGPIVLSPRITMPKQYSTSGYSGYPFFLFPWDVGFANLKVIGQAAWDDSVTGKFNLTQAYERTLPGAPPPKEFAKRDSIFAYKTSTGIPASAQYGPYPYYYANPAFCYGK